MFGFRRRAQEREKRRAAVHQREAQALVDALHKQEAEAAAKLAERFTPSEIAIIKRVDIAKDASDKASRSFGRFDTPSERALKEVEFHDAIEELVNARAAMDAMMQRKREADQPQ